MRCRAGGQRRIQIMPKLIALPSEAFLRDLRSAAFELCTRARRERFEEAENAIAELDRFARGLTDDRAAVEAGLSQEWSNGQTEGQVNKLKLLKRQMYGRANFDLLRRRVLQAA